MRHIWTVLCQESSINKENNLLTLRDCVEKLVFTIDKDKAPKGKDLTIPINLQLISLWIKEDKNKIDILDIKTELLDPDTNFLGSSYQKIDVDKDVFRLRNITNIESFKIAKNKKGGRYIIKTMQKKKNNKNFEIVSEIPIDIEVIFKSSRD